MKLLHNKVCPNSPNRGSVYTYQSTGAGTLWVSNDKELPFIKLVDFESENDSAVIQHSWKYSKFIAIDETDFVVQSQGA